MPVITLAEVKTFLNESTSTYNSVISALIPVVTERLRTLCNSDFTVQPLGSYRYRNYAPRSVHVRGSFSYDLTYEARGSRFYGAVPDSDLYVLAEIEATFDASSLTVTARGSNFASAQFTANQDILIAGSYLNDGFYEVSAVSTSTLTILTSYSFTGAATATHTFADEATGASISFGVIKWPNGIKPVVASLIQWDYQQRGQWQDSPSGEGWGEYGYPIELLRGLQPYTRPKFGEYRR